MGAGGLKEEDTDCSGQQPAVSTNVKASKCIGSCFVLVRARRGGEAGRGVTLAIMQQGRRERGGIEKHGKGYAT